jgi:hypothetical protein
MQLTFRSSEVDNISILLEHIDLFDSLDGLDVEFLEGSLELLVIGARVSVDLLHLSSGGTLATITQRKLVIKSFLVQLYRLIELLP